MSVVKDHEEDIDADAYHGDKDAHNTEIYQVHFLTLSFVYYLSDLFPEYSMQFEKAMNC